MTDSDFEKQILRYKKKLYRFALSILKQKEDAQDAVQEVVLRMWKKRELLNSKENFESYCMNSIKNYALDLLRKRRNLQNYKESTPTGNIAPEEFENKDIIEKMQLFLKQLPVQQRMAIELKDFQGYEYEEISTMLEISVNAARVNVSRGRKRLYEKFKEEISNG